VNILLDSHTLVWTFLKDHRLSPRARRILSAGTDRFHFSVVSLWELSIKITIGKLRTVGSSIAYFRDECHEQGIQLIPLKLDHILRAETLPLHHRDPFDRLLIAQALEEDLAILTNDALFKKYPAKLIW
jgi:PIN domain nuclease of toxin-antitoxin system